MKYMNILEKLISLFNITKTSWVHLVCIGLILIFLLLLWRKKISKTKCFLLSTLSTILLFSYVIATHHEILEKTVDDVINQLFVNLYFPSIYVYLFILVVIYVTTLASLINMKKKTIYKTINGTFFLIINFVFTLILENIAKNKIDLFKKASIFSNKDLIILLEFSVSIFGIWLFALTITYLTEKITERIAYQKEKKEETVSTISDNTLTVSASVVEEEPTIEEPLNQVFVETSASSEEPQFIPSFTKVTEPASEPIMNQQMLFEAAYQAQYQKPEENTFIPETEPIYQTTPQNLEIIAPSMSEVSTVPTSEIDDSIFDLSSFIPKRKENIIITEQPKEPTILDQILNNTLPLTEEKQVNYQMSYQEKYEKKLAEEKNNYTLNDYRIFNKMLKDIKEHNQNNNIHIDKILEYRLITKYSEETYDLFKRMLKNYSN